ncbi:MAG: transketolase [Helicobacteraceae bacterium]|jgi:transketolase|nr:transketolase [Helicobacteraceae bacterium]
MDIDANLLTKMSNTLRFLSVDMVQKANSGHPGMPMGMADVISVFHFHYSHNPKNPRWLNRDRLIFSGGHGSALLYSFLHLAGYDLTLDDLKNFRQLGSKTPGHPETIQTPGIDATTGPLGQGFANAVGFALASRLAAERLNTKEAKIIDHKVWCFCGDGDLMEGISYESASIAGHLKLNNLIALYDSNRITIDGSIDLTFSEDVAARFRAQNWDVIPICGHNFSEINSAFERAKKASKPTLIISNSTIAKGAATMEGSNKTHGAPLGEAEIAASKAKAGWSGEQFYIPDEALVWFRSAIDRGEIAEREWNALLNEHPAQKESLRALVNPNFDAVDYPSFDSLPCATRDTNGVIMNAIAAALPGFVGGSADLESSNKTEIAISGRGVRFGIREHAMAAICNAIALYGTFIPFNATFFVFSDYLKPSVRTAALMKAKNIFIWTHDSIGVGEDGATHQPIEQISAFRALPGFYLFRPADGAENIACWKLALTLNAPSGFVLSRQKLDALDRSCEEGDIAKGAYLLVRNPSPRVSLIATGSEVALAIAAAAKLKEEGIGVNVVSAPCFDLLCEQEREYIDWLIDSKTTKIAIEAARAQEWYRFADHVLGIDSFGLSAPPDRLYELFGFTAEAVTAKVKALL